MNMKEAIEGLQLTRLSRLLRAWQAVCILTVVLCWVLFGWFKALFLCVVSGLSYCSAAYLYYNTEARQWREQVDQWYQELFVWALGYEHPPSSSSRLQAALESSLQRPGQLPSSIGLDTGVQNRGSSSGKTKSQPSKMCHKEAQKMIQLIMQHFVHQWYNGITTDFEFPEDVQKILEHVALEINVRMKGIELEEIVREVAALVIPYLEAVNKAGERDLNGIKVFDVIHDDCAREFENNINVEHRSLRSREQELRYYRQALDTLIQCAVPNEYAVCDPACMFVREILLANIIEPLLNLLCDPDFLYESIPVVLSKASKAKVERELAEIQHENEKLEKQLSRGRLIVKMQGQQRIRFHSFTNRFGHSFTEGSPGGLYHSPLAHSPHPSPPTYRRASPRHSTRPVSTLGIPSTASSRDSPRDNWRFSMQDPPREGIHGMARNYLYKPQDNPAVPIQIPSQAVQQNEGTPHVQLAQSLPPQYTVQGIHLQEDYYDDVGSEEVESAPCEPDMVYVELPSIYIERHVRVVSGPSSHIAYVFKFPKRMLNESELIDLKVSESDAHLEGMKRYSEFLSLHNKLLKSSNYARRIKGLELPDRGRVSSLVSKLPFGIADPDPAFLLERKQGLEKYLQSISSVGEIAESDCFHNFLTTSVQSLKSAHHVVPNPQKPTKRRSFLGIVKAPVAEDVLKAEPIPKRPIEAVLSGYLNTHLPLPCCSFHSIHSIHTKRQKLSHHQHQLLDPLPHPSSSSYSLSSRAQSRVFGSSALELNLANASPTQSFGSTVSTTEDSAEIPTVTGGSIGENPPTTVGESSLQPTTSAVTTAPDLSNSSGEKTQTTGIVSDDSIGGGSDEQSITGTNQRTKAVGSSDIETETSSSSVRLRGKNVRKASREKMPTKSANVESDDNFLVLKMKIKRLILLVMMYIARLASLISYIVRRGLDPITQHSTLTIAKEHEKRVPLTNALLSLGTEASSKHCPELWACSEDIQLALLVVVGGASERYLWKELKEVVYAEENWARALYHLRHTLWPGGEVMKASKRVLSEKERLKKKQEAAEAIKKFLPNFLPYVVGAEDYNAAAIHCLNCLANPRINRHFILRIVEVFLMRLIPEINDGSFKARLERLRTLKMANSKSSLSSLSAFHRRTLPRSDTT